MHSEKRAHQTTALQLDAVGRSFGKVDALKDITLSIQTGEIICLVGHSGCGKSSLLRIIAGVDRPDSGVLSMNGRQVAGPQYFVEPEMRRIGFVFQDYALFPHLTAEQNILFGLKALPKEQASERAKEVIDHVGIASLTKRYPHMLSGGEQQRVALARALAPNPDILLMDEPFSSLDSGLRQKVRQETFQLLRRLGTTVIMVTHDPEEALSAGDRIVLMREGQIVQIGTGYDLHDRPNSPYAADFFGEFNKIPGIYRNAQIETVIGPYACEAALPEGSDALAYVRPHAISVSTDEGPTIGKIVERVFLGDVEQLTVDVEGLSQPLHVKTVERFPHTTNHISLAIKSDGLLIFAA
ncbi:ABC transporter ATP-binding protein [Phyllobacterium sp. YR531]|uniref:ABC transporter ATP-binding protein n=1 Tax=Phyllobacterium sp. YR531 TaxID=1144343 RepID=UPI00026FC43C|nr:ABC transporter ATP-binding protein [Phyllobacterium sp. YR531]EJM97833.1 ABC-type spermidine/putrescine transport system, ATPase component [Phyllobacterium sp. YR531]